MRVWSPFYVVIYKITYYYLLVLSAGFLQD
jgi:hypothetical protein